jgi:acetamidase/formamidase
MALHLIEPDRATLHGCFSRELPPVLTVDSGDTIRVRTLDAGWGLEPHTGPPWKRRRHERIEGRDRGHALCGPIAVRRAEPGMTLAVRIERIQPGAWGWTFAGGFATKLNQRLGLDSGDEYGLTWELDAHSMTGRNQSGETVRLRPFMGVLGNAPAEPGIHSTFPPRHTGGNLDCKELIAGSTLYLPIAVPGALFSIGDGHAAQGDGEVCGQAIECPMDVVEITLSLHEDLRLKLPRADSPAGWITFGFNEDLNVAMLIALEEMLELLCEDQGWERKHALAMASLLADFRVTQIVNGQCGVHAIVPHDTLASLRSEPQPR